MREASAESPFSAATRQERQARWLLWQQRSVAAEAADNDVLQERQTPQPAYAQWPEPAPIRHSRYDAVIRRMQNAKRQTGIYSAWS